ncbi:MAG: mycofactocin biosynthesis peptidyl-dipeptidase MftE [Acidimicrobiales bacterium]
MTATSEPEGARLGGFTSPEVAERSAASLLLVPLGSTEQHGPHLPLATDTLLAEALCGRVATARRDVMVAPAVPYGSSGEHDGFVGTLSIGQAALELLVTELVRAADAFAGVVLVSGHGGNAGPLARAVDTLRTEGRAVLAWSPRVAGGDAHAGRTETSIVLALGEPVRVEAAEAGNTRPLEELLPTIRAGGVAVASANGVLGDPAGASAEEGEHLLVVLTAQLIAAIDKFAG